MLRLLVLLLFAAPAFGTDPPKLKITFPELPKAVRPPDPPELPGATQPLAPGQWYVIESTGPLVVDTPSPNMLTVVERQGPLTIPIECVVGRKPAKDGEDFVTFVGPHLYVVKVAADAPLGFAVLQIIPALNGLDKDGKQIPLKRTDVLYRTIEVKAGHGPQPPPTKPVDPPVVPAGKLYFLIVRADGPASPAFTKVMEDPAWNTLRQAGHLIKDKTLAESKTFKVKIADGTQLPCVVTLKYDSNGTTMSQVRDATVFPTTPELILRLPEGVTK